MRFVYCDGGRSLYFKAKNVGDCVSRAIANATGLDYKQVYKDLTKLAGGSVRNGTPPKAYKKYLDSLGWKWVACSGIGTGCQVHLCESELPKGKTLIVRLSKHLTCVKDGVLYDTYDCTRDGSRCVYGYWVKA